MNELKDKDLREALRRKEALRTKPKVPADFCDGIMEEITPKKNRPAIWRWMSAAAAILILIGVGTTVMRQETGVRSQEPGAGSQETGAGSQETRVWSQEAGVRSQETGASTLSVSTRKTASTEALHTAYKQDEPTVQTVSTKANSAPKSQETIPNLHYAAYTPTEDSTYQAPSRMDEFIAKMAAFNEVEAVPLDCTPGDSMAVNKAYIFDDKQDLDLFGRLLQAACWYDSKTPGYLLNFSHQQFFFTLKDLHKHEKYLWIAERIIGGRILLYSTHSPIETEVSSACYQKYREQLTHTNMSTLF